MATEYRAGEKRRFRRACLEALQDRRLLALLASPSAFEQEMLELINQLRADPLAGLGEMINLPVATPASSGEPAIDMALRVSQVDGDQLVQQFRSLPPAPPLAWADPLYDVAQNYAERMIAAQQQRHDLPLGANRSLAQEVFAAAGDDFLEWTDFHVAENLMGSGESVLHAHAALAIDWAMRGIQNPPAHRNNLMRADRREVGIAVVRQRVDDTIGVPDVTGPFVVVQEFATRNPPDGFAAPYLLGVAHVDVNRDGRYTAGEAVRGVTVTVSGVDGTATPELNSVETAYPSGAYQLRLPAGRYDVHFAGGELDQPRVVSDVEITAGMNRKVDLIDAREVETPVVEFNPVEQVVDEATRTVSAWPVLSEPARFDVVIPFSVAGNATEGLGGDYTISPSPLVIPAGAWFAPIEIRLSDDAASDPDETIVITLETPENATLGSAVTHTLSVVDDDPLPAIDFSERSLRVEEAMGEIEIAVRLDVESERDVVVPFEVSGSVGPGDYAISVSPLVIPAGSRSGSIRLSLVDESVQEQEETALIALGEPLFARRGAGDSAVVTIVDNDEEGEWRNPLDRLDVTNDGFVTSRDVLVGINELNARRLIDSLGQLPDRSGSGAEFYYDISGDGILAPADILLVINAINRGADRESEGSVARDRPVWDAVAWRRAVWRAPPHEPEDPRLGNCPPTEVLDRDRAPATWLDRPGFNDRDDGGLCRRLGWVLTSHVARGLQGDRFEIVEGELFDTVFLSDDQLGGGEVEHDVAGRVFPSADEIGNG